MNVGVLYQAPRGPWRRATMVWLHFCFVAYGSNLMCQSYRKWTQMGKLAWSSGRVDFFQLSHFDVHLPHNRISFVSWLLHLWWRHCNWIVCCQHDIVVCWHHVFRHIVRMRILFSWFLHHWDCFTFKQKQGHCNDVQKLLLIDDLH